jgi:hypothetical protein
VSLRSIEPMVELGVRWAFRWAIGRFIGRNAAQHSRTLPNPQKDEIPLWGGISVKRLKGFEPSTFCMASRRSSSLTELIEVRPPDDAKTKSTSVALDWARRYPCEEVWRARKREG